MESIKNEINQNIDFDSIRKWLSDHLNKPNKIVHSSGRKVVITSKRGIKEIEIPVLTSENKDSWKQAWLDVFESCLDALEFEVTQIYAADRNTGLITQLNDQVVKIGANIIKVPNGSISVEYARALEKIIFTYGIVKAEEKKRVNTPPININHRVVKIENPNTYVSNMKTEVKSVSIPTIPSVGSPDIVMTKADTEKYTHEESMKLENDEYRVNTVRMALQKNVNQESQNNLTNNSNVKLQKIPDDVFIDKDDCEIYKNDNLVIATCTSVKHGDGVFRDNIEMLKENIPSINIASFISGKASNADQAAKEGMKIVKLLNDCDVNRFVIYEVNNDYINGHLNKKDSVTEAVNAATKICDILTDADYFPIICMDLDTYGNVNEVMTNYNRYPMIKCVTPKQKNLVDENEDILYMNPNSDVDAIMISNLNIKNNIESIINNSKRESYSKAI